MKKFLGKIMMAVLVVSVMFIITDTAMAAHQGITPTGTQMDFTTTNPTSGAEVFVNDPGKFLLEKVDIGGKPYYRMVINDGTVGVDQLQMSSITRAFSDPTSPDAGGFGVAVEMALVDDRGTGAGSDKFSQGVKIYTDDFAKNHGAPTSIDITQSMKNTDVATSTGFSGTFGIQQAWTTSAQKLVGLNQNIYDTLDVNNSFRTSFDMTFDAEQVGLNRKTLILNQTLTDVGFAGGQTITFTDDFFARIIGTENGSVVDQLSDKQTVNEANAGNPDFDEVFELEVARLTTGSYTSPWSGATVVYNGDKVIAVGFTEKISLNNFTDFFGYNFVEDLTDTGNDVVDKADRLWFSSADQPTNLLAIDLVAGQP